jgi:flagellar biosynthesis/type III secretory pathway M-ring protein FliF/YscJ
MVLDNSDRTKGKTMIVILCLLGAAVVFLAIVVALLYFQIVRPMQRKQTEQEDTIARNAGATIGLFFANRKEINAMSVSVKRMSQRMYTEPAACLALPSYDTEPQTDRLPVLEGPATARSAR